MSEFDEMLDWLLHINSSDDNADGVGDFDGNVQQLNDLSPLQISDSQDCSAKLFCDVSMSSQLDPQAGLNKLILESAFSHDPVLVPNSAGHVEQPCSRAGSSSNLIVDGTSSSAWDFSRRDGGGEQVQKVQAEEQTIEHAKFWRKNDCPRRQRRDAEKHSQAEKKRRHKFNQKIRTLQSLIPDVDKVDTASVLGKAIDYVKSLQLHVNEMLLKVNPTVTPLGACTAALQSFQHPQFGPMEPRINEQMSFNDGKPVIPRSLSIPPLHSSHQECCLSRASSLAQFHGFPPLPSPLVQMPHPPERFQYEGFRPPYWFRPVALGVPTALDHHQLPSQTQDAEDASNTKVGHSNCGTGSS